MVDGAIAWLADGWKSDALRVYSDWKIIIFNSSSSNNETTEYRVHRLALGKGPCKSGYFETLFASTLDGAEQQNGASRIDLETKSAKLFPTVLDFIYNYTLDSSVQQREEDLFVLFSLAEYFAIPTLTAALIQICHQNVGMNSLGEESKLDMEKLAVYLSRAEENPGVTGNLYTSLLEKCAALVEQIPNEMAGELKPKWLLAILESGSTTAASLGVTKEAADRLVPRCLLSHVDAVDAETVDELLACTSSDSMSPQNAVRVLTVLNRVDLDFLDEGAEYNAFLASLRQEEGEPESKSAGGDNGVSVSVTSDDDDKSGDDGEQKPKSSGTDSGDDSVESGDEEQDRKNCDASSDQDSVEESDPLDAIAKLGPNNFRDSVWEQAKKVAMKADAVLDDVDCESFVSDSTGGSLWQLEHQKCIDAITSGWKELCDEDDDEMLKLIANLDGRVLFAMTRQAKRELEQSSERMQLESADDSEEDED